MKRTLSTLAAALATFGASAMAQQIFFDDFNDGDDAGWTHADYNVTGTPWGPPIFNASAGTYRLATTGRCSAASYAALISYIDASVASPTAFADGELRTTVRAITQGTSCGVFSRVPGTSVFEGYSFAASTALHVFVIEKLKLNSSNIVEITQLGRLEGPSFAFNFNEPWNMACATVGDRISLKVWRVGEAEPATPQLVVYDRTFIDGSVGLQSYVGGSVTGTIFVGSRFDDVSFTAMQPCAGDLNDDGQVDLTDLSGLLSNFGVGEGLFSRDGDIDYDGDVDLSDLSALLAAFGTSCG